MSLLSPWFLAGLAALAVPLLLHRLARRTAEERPWSSLLFFRNEVDESVRHRRYRYFTLLAFRLLVPALLALLFARPVLEGALVARLPTASRHVLAVDTSMSVGHGEGGERARRAARAVLGSLGRDDRSQLVAFGPGVRVLGAPTADHGSWRGLLDALAPTSSRASYGELAEAVRTLAQDDPAPVVLHVVSDFQRTGAPARFTDLGLPPGATLVTHDASAPPRPNWCIEGVTGVRRLHGEERTELQVTVAGFDTEEASRRVELHVGGAVVASAEVAVPASGRATARFPSIEVPRGQTRAEVRLHPGDGLPADDRFFVSLERTDPLPVLFLRAARDERAELFYRTALEAAGEGTFRVQAATPEAAQTLALDHFSFVVLHDLSRLPALLEGRLRAYLERGHTVFVVMGTTVARDKTAPWLTGGAVDSGRSERPLHATSGAALPEVVAAAERLGEVRFFRHVRAASDDERNAARLADGAPLLFTGSLGAGRLLFLASPFDTAWNDWPVHASFVPFALASARWLAGLDDTSSQATVDDVRDLAAAGYASGASTIEVIDPSGRPALGLAASVSARRVALGQAGFYEIRRPGHHELVAVNPDPRESDLRVLDGASLERWKATGGDAASGADATATRERETRDLFPYLLWALVAVVLAESTLANRYLRP